MPRTRRHKSQQSTFYHLYNRVAGDPNDHPFQDPVAAKKFLSLCETYLDLYFCCLAAFELMGNHYHLVVFVEQFRELSWRELKQRARLRFGPLWRWRTRHWSRSRWEQFNRDLFDVSCFMQHVNGEFSKWFNRRYQRRGPFWADRFKNSELLDLEAVQTAILYTELNAVRAGLVQRPEAYRMGSAHWRWSGQKSALLIPLEQLFPAERGEDSFTIYRALLYHRGAVTTNPNQAVIPDWILQDEQARGFARPGALRQRLRGLTDGVAIGGWEPVRRVLEHYRREGRYVRRRNPIPQLGTLFSLREQRSHAFSPG
jgi:hypothetical protein